MAPALPIPMPMPSVESITSGTDGATDRMSPKPMIATRHPANVRPDPKRAASRGPTGANTPMHRTGIVVSSPAIAADRPRSSRISGSSGPIARICGRIASEARNSPAMTASGTPARLKGTRGRASGQL
jgi:hypothetical protein